MTEFARDFEDALGLSDSDVTGDLTRDVEVIDETSRGDLDIRFISNLKVRRSVPKVEISYFSNSKMEDAKGDILFVEDGEVMWDEGTPGHHHPTDGIVFDHPIEELKSKIGTNDNTRVISAAYSAGYGLRSIISRNLGVDSLDVQCSAIITRRDVRLVVHDSDVGGAGLTHAVFKELESFLQETQASLENCVCSDFCENCLLLPRTDPTLIEKNLLDRFEGLHFLMKR